ncbi:MAG: neutral/alkaline non-lysosomal ceramidase N-terminal domain-containing protein [Sedimentisphaerales bacterium]|jgi:sugar phosphate isomerase/epimerase|nr:neutral/alkaline non-lysosomal ceramidase N-terminal domain-containing protein [Sedimentisphaerales bacterium]HNY78471.1 neutral/alkaline non-lysosomal ceramidase N-terminal domain-containing protein [Sedimentisphaerales bacterium]HOC63671.1 neutral/alkaline non-lysosomal ceramidase N-terminal domain-containing protein [Sedimentisphaerales bacterium]HOH64390.1 neutral/alkaline non-lysosomal ceramidase N-terminal domain-containing protein [Sedimentisphaerales bacterium]HQA89659.1 neutral/alka
MKTRRQNENPSMDTLSRRGFLTQAVQIGAAGWTLANVEVLHAQTNKPRWQIGCYTRPWDQYDYRVALDAIAEAGYEYVGLMTTKSETHLVISVATPIEEALHVGDEVRRRGLKVVSVYGGDIPVARSLEAGIEGLRKLIDNCAACGSTNLLMGGTGDRKLYDAYYKAIAECCDYAAERGIGISIKPHGGLNATGPQCRGTIESIGHKNFRIWYDPGNIYYYSNGELSPVVDAPSVNGLVSGMCVKDYRHPKDVLVTPGTGQVDFRVVFALLNAGGFEGGPLVVECLDPGDLPHTLEEAKKARRFLEELTGQKSQRADHAARRDSLEVGVGVVDITPPLGYRMSGYFHERLSEGVSNPLHAKAIVMRQGATKAAMVFCDIIGLSPDVSRAARQRAESMTGIPAANILLAATHSHTGPLYWGTLRNHFHEQALAKSGQDPCESADYSAMLAERIVQAIRQADSAVRPVRVEAGIAQQQGLSFNRRFHMKDGTVRFNPGVLNPDIVRAAGPIDPSVGVVLFRTADRNEALAGLVNFALHLDTVGGTQYAADYPYYLEQELRQTLGGEFTLLFGTGTCGDINHIDVTRQERLKTDEIGRTLAQTVVDALAGLKAAKAPSLAVARAVVEAPLQTFTADEIEQARRDIHKVGTQELPFLDQVRAYKILALQWRGGPTLPLEVQVFRLSDEIAVVGLPGEVFVDLGLAIKQASPFATTLVIELCQDAPGYIPTRKAFAEGSYETVNSRVAPGGGERMADAAIELLAQLAPAGTKGT